MEAMVNKEFWKGRKVLITGHTGFKGSWLSMVLNLMKADVYGYALEPNTKPSLYKLANIDQIVSSTIGEIRDFNFLLDTLKRINPEIVIHLAAQPLVMESYNNPRETYEINVMGTVNLLDAIRKVKSVKAVVNVTTDKCYENREWPWGYREYEPMGGYDPYSNSKGCSELVSSSYRNSFFNPNNNPDVNVSLATARAGNIIGGGDWAKDRLIPDFIRSISIGEQLKIRSPHSIRPWQHVMEPLSGYLILCEKLYSHGHVFAESWNFGPNDTDVKNVEWVTKTLCEIWGKGASYRLDNESKPHEASCLKLDCSKAKSLLDWSPKWNIQKALKSVVEWNKAYLNKGDMRAVSLSQIEEYFNEQ